MILTRTGIVALATVSLLAACSEADTDSTPVDAPTDDDVAVLATTSIWADITSEVFCGEPVAAIIPVGADPHSFEPSLRDREALGDADLVVANGAETGRPVVAESFSFQWYLTEKAWEYSARDDDAAAATTAQ